MGTDFEPLRTKIIQQIHYSSISGHPGPATLLEQVTRAFFLPNLFKDLRRFVLNCQGCGRSQVWREKKGLLKPLPIPLRQ